MNNCPECTQEKDRIEVLEELAAKQAARIAELEEAIHPSGYSAQDNLDALNRWRKLHPIAALEPPR